MYFSTVIAAATAMLATGVFTAPAPQGTFGVPAANGSDISIFALLHPSSVTFDPAFPGYCFLHYKNGLIVPCPSPSPLCSLGLTSSSTTTISSSSSTSSGTTAGSTTTITKK